MNVLRTMRCPEDALIVAAVKSGSPPNRAIATRSNSSIILHPRRLINSINRLPPPTYSKHDGALLHTMPYLCPWVLVEHAHDGDLSHGSLPGPCRRPQQDAFVAVVEHMEQLRLDRVEVFVSAPAQTNTRGHNRGRVRVITRRSTCR